jgi:DNA-binding response OmpR family regulator
VILVSGFADEIDRAKHLKRVAHVVAKPVTLEGIRAAVRAALG